MQTRVLIAGSGPSDAPAQTWEAEWKRQGYEIFRLDIDPRNAPDIVGSMTAIGMKDKSFAVVYCCHALEHLYPHEVGRALREFHRVLEAGGHVVIMVPDLEGVQPTEEELDVGCPGITGLHLYYGDARQIEQYPYMAHHCGFVDKTLYNALRGAGFENVNSRRTAAYNLMASGQKA